MTATARATTLVLALTVPLGCGASQPAAPPDEPIGDAVTVADVTDGDSFESADGTRFRLQGLNAPDAGECLAEEAADRLAELLDSTDAAVVDAGTDHFGRTLVYVHVAGATVNELLVGEGLALAIHTDPPGRLHRQLFDAQSAAQRNGSGLWEPRACGGGAGHEMAIVEVRGDPPGPDHDALDREYVVIENQTGDTIDLTGWTLRDESTQNRFEFPTGTVLEPSETVTVTSGGGPLGFGLDGPVWNNTGDTAYLIDDRGGIAAWSLVEDAPR